MNKFLLALLCLPLSGCSGYLVEDFETFRSRIAEDYPVGSSEDMLARDLRRHGFRKSGPAFIPTANDPDPLPVCFNRNMSYGFWAGGRRWVCARLDENQTITEIKTYELVAGL